MHVKKAILPVAGLGTRFLPVTKAVPKEMLPIIDKPVIHYVVEEAFSAGIEQIILVNGHHKYSIENYFDTNYELNDILLKKGNTKSLKELEGISSLGSIFSVRQQFPAGLGHAVLCAKPFVGDEPFAVLLGDDVIRSTKKEGPAIGQLMKAYQKTHLAQVAVMQVDKSEVHKYGAAEGVRDKLNKAQFHIHRLVEKPKKGTEKTDVVVVGRYVLDAGIWPILQSQKPHVDHEIQLTDALAVLAKAKKLRGYFFAGDRIDTGDRIGFLRLTLLEALARSDLRSDVKKMLQSLS